MAHLLHADGHAVERAAHRVPQRRGGGDPPQRRRGRHGLADTTFNGFAAALEGIHNSGHVWVGGSMQAILTAPCDPVFWMHHAEIDRIWAVWQSANPGKNPPLTGAAATMDPWSQTESDTRDPATLGYRYV